MFPVEGFGINEFLNSGPYCKEDKGDYESPPICDFLYTHRFAVGEL